MSLAIAEAMLSDLKWSREFLADKFVECFKRDPRTWLRGAVLRFPAIRRRRRGFPGADSPAQRQERRRHARGVRSGCMPMSTKS
jgi:hypothetical protein